MGITFQQLQHSTCGSWEIQIIHIGLPTTTLTPQSPLACQEKPATVGTVGLSCVEKAAWTPTMSTSEWHSGSTQLTDSIQVFLAYGMIVVNISA
jgi:hypothetical protein